MKNNKGFSLVELIVVIAIMAILAAVAIPTFATFINKANLASDESFLNDLKYAAEMAHAASGDKITDVQVTIDDGKIVEAAYKVVKQDGTTVKGTVIYTHSNKTANIYNDANYNGFVVDQADVDAMVAMIDWEYNFKSEKDGTFAINTEENAKALATVTKITASAGETPADPEE